MSSGDDKLKDLLTRSQPPQPSARLDAIRQAVHAELALHPKATPWWRDALTLVGVNLLVGAGATMAMRWNTAQHASAAGRVGASVLLMLVMGAGAVLALRPGRKVLRIVALVAVVATAAASILVGSGVATGPLLGGLGCALTECVLSVIPMVVTTALLTRFAWDSSRALLGGAAAGAGGMLALHLHCPNGDLAHLAVFHVAPWLVLSSLVVLVRWVLPSRSVAP